MTFRVYYLDDDKDLLDAFFDNYSSTEVEVAIFDDANDAIQAIENKAPDLFFIDYRLPNMSGDDVAKKVPASIPKILISGELNLKLKSNFLKIIEKPYRVAEVEKIINEYRSKK